MGPTFTIESPPRDGEADGSLFGEDAQRYRISGPPKFFTGGSPEPESSSSIGTPDDSEEDEEEVQSGLKGRTGLGSLDCLEDSLPIKLVPCSPVLFPCFVLCKHLMLHPFLFLFGLN